MQIEERLSLSNIMHKTFLVAFIIFLGINIQCDGSYQVAEQDPQEHEQLSNDKIDMTQIPKDQVPLVRLPSNTLLKYTAYKDVSILHFRIPPDTRTALFTFKAYEESKSAFQRVCTPRDVSLHLKAGSYPVISPENITFPRHFLSADQRFQIYNLQFKSNGKTQRLTIDGPQSGNWFAVAFISWTDPNNERIEQQGLAVSCETLLLSEMSVSRIIPFILNSGQNHSTTLTSDHNGTKEISYKFYVPRNVAIVTARITIGSVCFQCPDIGFYVQANALPSENNYIHRCLITTNEVKDLLLKFYVQSGTWHFIDLKFVKNNQSNANTNGNNNNSNSKTGSIEYCSSLVGDTTGTAGNNMNRGTTTGSDSYSNLDNNSLPMTSKLESNRNQQNLDQDNDIGYSNISNFSNNKNEGDKKVNDEDNENDNDKNNNYSNNSNTWPEVDISIQFDFHEEEHEQPSENLEPEKPVMFRNIEFYPLLRQTYREFFMFDYDLLPDSNGTVPTLLNLTAGTPVGFKFDVGDVYDIGGTLSFAVSLRQDMKAFEMKSSSGLSQQQSSTSTTEKKSFLAEKLVDKNPNKEEEMNDDSSPGHNNSNSNTNSGTILILNTDGSNNPGNTSINNSNSSHINGNQTIVICMRLGEPGEPQWPDKCLYGKKLYPAAGIVNNSDAESSTGLIHVPFPESGQWYITMGLFCHGEATAARVTIIDSVKEFIRKYSKMLIAMKAPCSCANFTNYYRACIEDRHCLTQMNETETLKIKECLMDSKCTANYLEMTKKFELHHKFATEQSVATEGCNASVIFTVSSSPCVAGRCGRYGRCYHYMSGGFVFSTCLCIKGYRGWDCTEDSQVPSSFSILIASLLLTLSNLLFIPSIYMAMQRKYHTESVIYFFAMFFSIFYHACDSGEDEYSFCLVKISVLQFCDFYCGLLAIWVTLIAMAHIRQQFVSLLHMFGAIVLAFGTELNKQSLWVFLAPALTGICIISTSWGMRCRKTHKWFPSRKYLTIYMPIGSILVMVGLICYAFLQTKQNYHIVHSIWHMVMALSLLCLLPSRNSFLPKC